MTMKGARVLRIAIMGGLLAAGTAEAGPITFLTALPVAQSQVVVRGQYLFIRASDDPTPADRRFHGQRYADRPGGRGHPPPGALWHRTDSR